jgi:hypothetical protein
MRLLTLPLTIARVPIELGFGAAKQAVKFAQGLVGGGGEEPVAEEPRPAPPPRRRRTSSRAGAKSGNGRARSGAATKRASRRTTGRSRRTAEPSSRTAEPSRSPVEEAMKAAPPVEEPESATAAAPSTVTPAAAEPSTVTPPAAEPPPADEPVHVSEEPELVAETAETGAEDGAGAEVAVDEPWTGYDEMTAADIEDRLLTEGPETAAAVRLYEASHKGRASILEAASRTMTV